LDVSIEEVTKFFNAFGETSEIVIIKDKITKNYRGFGFVTFKDE
jgi:RNA recognition motif-containing protein